jgi:hypothetical protein
MGAPLHRAAIVPSALLLTAAALVPLPDHLPVLPLSPEPTPLAWQAGVMRTAGSSPGHAPPTTYFVWVANDGDRTLWVEVRLELRGQRDWQRYAVRRVEPHASVLFSWPAFTATWGRPLPLEVSAYGDSQRRERLFTRRTAMTLPGERRSAFERAPPPLAVPWPPAPQRSGAGDSLALGGSRLVSGLPRP